MNQGQGLEVWSILNLKTEPDVIYNGDGDLFTFEPPKIIVNSAGNNGAFVIFNQPYRTIVSFFTFLEELSRCAAKAPMLRKHCLSDMARYVGRTGERALTVAPRYVGLKEKLFEKIQELPGEEERAYWIWCALRAKNSSLYQIYHTARGFFSPGENREGTALFKLKQSLKGSSYARMLDQPFTGEGMPSFEVFQTMAHKPPAQSAVDNRFSLFAFIRGLKRTPPLSNNEKISERPYSNGAL